MTTPGPTKPGKPGSYDDLDLMLRHDGELSAEERAAMDAEGAELSDDARAKLESLTQVGDLVRGRLELAADDAGPRLDALWGTIERSVTEAAPAQRAAGASSPAARAARAAQTDGAGLWDGVRSWMERWRSNMLTGAVCAAAAALVIMAIQRPGSGPGGLAQGSGGPTGTAPAGPAVNNPSQGAVQQTLVAQPPVVESLEVPGGSGTVLTIPGEDGENPTTVIWVTADDIVEDPI